MAEPVGFGVEITLDRREVFDVVARCEEVVELAERELSRRSRSWSRACAASSWGA